MKNVTKGEAQVIKIEMADFKQLCVASKGKQHVICHMYLPEYEIKENHLADAELFADALNTHNTTGFTPSELKKQRDDVLRLKEAWSTADILRKLNEAAKILLHEKDYDRHGWEEIEHCTTLADDLLQKLSTNTNEG